MLGEAESRAGRGHIKNSYLEKKKKKKKETEEERFSSEVT